LKFRNALSRKAVTVFYFWRANRTYDHYDAVFSSLSFAVR